MRVKIAIVVCSLFCFLVDPVLAASLRVAKVYRDYPGYINPAVCENPNVSKSQAVPAPQKIAVPLPVVPETAAGTSVKPDTPAPMPASVNEPVSPSAPIVSVAEPAPSTLPATAPAMAANPLPDPAPASKPNLTAPASSKIEPLNPASASQHIGNPVQAPYLSLWAGMVAHHDVEIDVDDNRATFDTGIAGGVAVGYDFGPARVEIEGSYRHSNADEGDADLEVTTLMANVYADFETDGSATPYLGVGVGVADVDLEDEDDQVLAGQVAAGMLFALTEKVAIDLGYRYMVADAPDIVGNEKALQQHTALIGVQIKF